MFIMLMPTMVLENLQLKYIKLLYLYSRIGRVIFKENLDLDKGIAEAILEN